MTGLLVVYYLFVTTINLIGIAFFEPEKFGTEFILATACLLPSIIFIVFHIVYFVNLRKYNEELTLTSTEAVVSK